MCGFIGALDTRQRKIVKSVHSIVVNYACQQFKGFKSVVITEQVVIGFSMTVHKGVSKMTKKEFAAVMHGDKILHRHYGECIVQELFVNMGIIIRPQTDEGKWLLRYHSGTPIGTPLLEHSLYNFRPIDRPFKEENKDLVHIRKLIKKATADKKKENCHVS